ncbi:MAG TPA: transglutaminase-like domain-containing protein [Opitutaceae bacterium]
MALPFLVARLYALTYADLLSDPKMTPRRFASFFRDFAWDTHPFDVQDPDQFLATRTGDCIDYAVLADHVLRRDGFGTRLIRIEMIGKDMGHAVCYVTEEKAYLDYNNRMYSKSLVRSSPAIRAIATKIADSFEAHWTFASEFTYSYKTSVKKIVMTVVETDPPGTDPDANRYTGAGAPRS